MIASNPDYPLRLDVDYPPRLSRLLIFVKWLLVIPHYLALFFLGVGVLGAGLIAWFAVLITGRYPRSMFNFISGTLRWSSRVLAYQFLITDSYPPFSLAEDPSYPVRLQFDYPEQIARWRPLVQWLLVIPAGIALYVILLIGYVAVFVAWFAILVLGRLPQGLFTAIMVTLRWTARVNAFQYGMTERYPPFVWG